MAIVYAGCGNSTGTACGLFEYVDPLFTIVEAKNAISGTPVSPVYLSSILFGDEPLPAEFLTYANAYGVNVVGDRLRCTVPCGFSSLQGEYQFAIGGAGYRDTTITLEGRYGRADGGCPSRFYDGVEITLALTPL